MQEMLGLQVYQCGALRVRNTFEQADRGVPWYDSCNISFFFNNPSNTEIYTLSLHDALPIFAEPRQPERPRRRPPGRRPGPGRHLLDEDRKSTRLNSSHVEISYAVFCLK